MDNITTIQEKEINLDSVEAFIGNTPLIPFPSLSTDRTSVWAKAEWCQMGQSVKARAAFNIIKRALKTGELENRVLLDASSGNTAIAYASIGAKLGIPVAICLPKNASRKRKDILNALGAELHLTSELEGTDGAQQVARALFEEEPEKYFYADQYNNDANWQAHYHGTAVEILEQTKGRITHFVTGLGTTGSFVGNAARLKEHDPGIMTIALGPDSPMHFLEGWKHLETAIVPGIFTDENIDRYLEIDSSEVLEMVKFIANHEGLLLSPSAAANLLGAKKVAESLEEGMVVTLLPDDISKYDEVLKTL
jgi:cysteine synthase B